MEHPALKDVAELLWLKLQLLARWAPARPAADPCTAQGPMFDYRYHALSLAAVLFALALGALSGWRSETPTSSPRAKSGIVHDLDSEFSSAHQQLDEQRSRVADQEAFADGLYPLAVHGLLAGRTIVLDVTEPGTGTVPTRR